MAEEPVICVDASPSKGRPTGLRQDGRYIVYDREAPTSCAYCKTACEKVDVGVGAFWCARRFALAFPGRNLTKEYETEVDPTGDLVTVGDDA